MKWTKTPPATDGDYIEYGGRYGITLLRIREQGNKLYVDLSCFRGATARTMQLSFYHATVAGDANYRWSKITLPKQ
jgi:hypothetical protein